MTTSVALHLFPYIASIFISGSVALFSWYRRSLPGATAFAVLAFAQAVWTVGYIFEICAPTEKGKLLWDNLQFLPTYVVIVSLYLFTYAYTQPGKMPRRMWVYLLAVPVISIVFIATDSRTHLLRANILDHTTEMLPLQYEFGPLFWGIFVYLYSVTLLSVWRVVSYFLSQYRYYWWQTGLVLLGMVIPIGGNLLFFIFPAMPHDVTPITFAMSNILIGLALFRFGLFDVLPVAYRTVIHSMHDMVLVLDASGRIVGLNPAIEAWFGIRRKDVLGHMAQNVFEPWSGSFCWEIKARRIVETAVFHEGKTCYLEVTHMPLGIERAQATGLLVVMHDITQRKLAEQALANSEARYRAIVDSAFVGMLVLQDHQVVYANQALSAIVGYEQDELITMSTRRLMRLLSPQHNHLLRRLYRETLPNRARHEVQARRKGGEACWLELFITTIEYQGREAIGVTFVDISERRLTEEQRMALIVEQEKVNLLTEFIKYAAHEFRTPLAVISTNAYLLNRLHDPVQREQKFGRIQHSVDDLAKLLDTMLELLDVEYVTQLAFVCLPVNNVLATAVSVIIPHIQSQTHQLIQELQPDLPPVAGDKDKLERAFVHILHNAVQFTPEKGCIWLKTYQQGNDVIVEIRDNGIGMTTSEQAQIFKRFYRANASYSLRGFGLGLSIAHKIVTLHNGRIDVTSEPGKGSTFKVCLPILHK